MRVSPNLVGKELKTRLSDTYKWANNRSGGVLAILHTAFDSFSDAHGAEGAASVAYFVFFSLIPLLLLLVSISGYLLADVDAIDQILDFIQKDANIPIPRELFENNLRQLLQARNIGSIIGVVGLVWSASGSFISLSRNINRAWPKANRLNFVQGRLIALAIVAVLVVMIVIWYATTNIINYVLDLDLPFISEIQIQQIQKSIFWTLSSSALPWLFVFMAFIILYRWVPNTRVRWIEALIGALVTSVAIYIATKGFTWFLQSGVVNFQLIYGSLGTILGFLSWVYITAFIAIMGAHISSAIAAQTRKPDEEALQKDS
jgi:membrane protein